MKTDTVATSQLATRGQWSKRIVDIDTIRRGSNRRPNSGPHRLRRTVQFIFLGISLFIGWRFLEFYHSCLDASHPAIVRPAGVDAFLPISALMSARFWLQTGSVQPVHPAGLLLFLAIVGISFLFKRSFCSWICPFGLLSEILADVGQKCFGRNFSPPRWSDWSLRAIKYLLMGFFVYVIFCRMDLSSLRGFLDSPFNQLADVHLLQFFLHLSTTAMVVLAILLGLSLVIRHFWCRYLCPYGALTAVFGLASPVRIKRDLPTCIDCGKCARACPARLPVHQLLTVRSDECSLCLECVESCPVAGTLGVSPIGSKRRIKPLYQALAVGGIVLMIVIVGKWLGHWQTSVTSDQTKWLIQMTTPQ